jgi:asparagine synthase (glutamine-hydrolysing)
VLNHYIIWNILHYFAWKKALFTAEYPKIADEGLQEYIFNRFVAGEILLYENISKVLPGHSMTLHQNGKIETEKWWDLKLKFKIKP